jgi:hypothetical protein
VAFWGVCLLAAALPSLACVPTLPRPLRMGSLGVRVAAALVGLTTGVGTAPAGALLSLGVVLGCGAEHLGGAWMRSRSRWGATHTHGQGETRRHVQRTRTHARASSNVRLMQGQCQLFLRP